jgi:hypothetical protein
MFLSVFLRARQLAAAQPRSTRASRASQPLGARP